MIDSTTSPPTKASRGSRFGVGRKLGAGMGLLLAVFVAMGAIIFSTGLQLSKITKVNEDASQALSLAANLNNFGARQKYIANDFLLTGRDTNRKSYADARDGFAKALSDTREIFTRNDPTLLPYLQAYDDLHAEWQAKVGDEEFRLGSQAATWEDGRALLKGPVSAALSDRSRTVGTALIKATQAWSDRWTEASRRELAFLQVVILLGVLSGAGVAILVGWLLTRSIVRPIVGMTAAMERLAAGDHAAETPAMGRPDEIGDMAAAVQVFKEAAVAKLRLESEAAGVREQNEAERHEHEAARAQTAKTQSAVVQQVAEGLKQLSRGRLAYRLSTPFSPEYEALRTDFNAAMAKLQTAIQTIATADQGIRSGTSEISHASEDLSHRTEQQAASLEETAAALDEITVTVRKTAEGATHARQVVANAKSDAERSGTVVQDAVSAMAEIEKSSQQISQIIGVIDEIAFQTNLLALNAGVEAARAGDAGRGFAVVASEVRALAQRSAEAAKEIKTLISASTEQVGAGVKLVGQTGTALQRIGAQIADINGVVAEIASSAQEQASGLLQVNAAVNQMDQVTQQNAAMVEQSTAASRALADEAQELGRLVAQFDVGSASESGAAYTARAA